MTRRLGRRHRRAAARARSWSSAPAASSAPTDADALDAPRRRRAARPRNLPAWRLEDCRTPTSAAVDLLVESNLDALLDERPAATVFDCVAYGGLLVRDRQRADLPDQLQSSPPAARAARAARRSPATSTPAARRSTATRPPGPAEDSLPAPNSDYAVSKVACANLIYYYGQRKRFPCANLRLYSVYGPLEDSSRLIPAVVRRGPKGGYPPFVNPDISRDFVYVDDVVRGVRRTAL